ncbi:hypothetical protein [Natronomonas sp. LN261]|jgi:hypothetical protein|uniref:hypothetical protein n=1 Tax=Natronomonas sp. LN261 TaxID=2750669 RepID=UPI0015EF82D0|nr:hypothetical protein [Natronomonas sp. LN261]
MSNRISGGEDATPSPWYCPHCEMWVGTKLDTCLEGHSCPRLPLYYDDVDVDTSWRVTLRDRVRSKLQRVIGR